jgi:hypothetical protein
MNDKLPNNGNGSDVLTAYIRELRKRPMTKLSRAEATLLIGDSPFIKLETNPENPCSGGRPREDKLATMARELKDQGKSCKEIKKIVESTTNDHRSEDAYRKLAAQNRKKPCLKLIP